MTGGQGTDDDGEAARRGPWATGPCRGWGWIRSRFAASGLWLLVAAAVLPFDGAIARGAAWLEAEVLGGDVELELRALQQFGQFSFSVVIGLVIWCVDPPMRRRLLDWGTALGLTFLAAKALKMVVGRGRPRLGDPALFLGPFGQHPYPQAEPPGVYHAWEVWQPISSDLWAMPSSHTAAAVAAAVFLGAIYPRVRPVVWVLAGVVGLSRVLFGAHWASDVIVGGLVGWLVAGAAVRGYWGVRLVDWAWRVLVDRGAEPALPGVIAASEGRRRKAVSS